MDISIKPRTKRNKHNSILNKEFYSGNSISSMMNTHEIDDNPKSSLMNGNDGTEYAFNNRVLRIDDYVSYNRELITTNPRYGINDTTISYDRMIKRTIGNTQIIDKLPQNTPITDINDTDTIIGLNTRIVSELDHGSDSSLRTTHKQQINITKIDGISSQNLSSKMDKNIDRLPTFEMNHTDDKIAYNTRSRNHKNHTTNEVLISSGKQANSNSNKIKANIAPLTNDPPINELVDNESTKVNTMITDIKQIILNKGQENGIKHQNLNEVPELGSSLLQHQKDTNHEIDWLNSKIIWNDTNSHKLLIKESLLIKASKPDLNRTTHSTPLYVFPEGLPKHLLPDPNG